MDKLEMAHEYAKIMLKAFYDGNAHWDNADTEIPSFAFEIADAMQAEADKRAVKGVPEALQNEWQPDWSVAPRCDVVAWDINEHGQARWIANDNGYYLAPSFGYNGNWQNSLRKRPVMNKD